MNLARLGGHRPEKRISPADVDGYIRWVRNSLKADAEQHVKSTPKGKAEYKPKAIGLGGGGETAPIQMDFTNGRLGWVKYQPIETIGDKRNVPRRQPVEMLSHPIRSSATPVIGCRKPGLVDKRDQCPTDVLTANTTLAEEPMRKLLRPDQDWMSHVLPGSTAFPIEVTENPLMTHLDHWLGRAGISIPVELAPVIKNRAIQSIPDIAPVLPSGEWMMAAFQDGLTYLSKTGTEKGGKKAVDLANALRANGHIPSRDGDLVATIAIGEIARRINYSPQPLTVGILHSIGIDFGDQLTLNNHLRTSLSEPRKLERNQFVILHLADAYELFRQVGPRRPPSASRVQTAAQLIRQEEYHDALRRSKEATVPYARRDYELLPAVRDVINAHHDRGLEIWTPCRG